MWGDGRIYVGSYKNDTKDGYGEFYWPDGRSFKGNWKNGKQNGEGIMYEQDGKLKKGLWKDGEYGGKDLFNSGIQSENISLAQNSCTTRRFDSPDITRRQNQNSSSRNQSRGVSNGLINQQAKREEIGELKSKTKRDMEFFELFPSTTKRGS